MMNKLPAAAIAAGRHVFAGLVDLLLPRVCGACEAPDVGAGGLCRRCGEAMLSMVALPYCPRCGATIGPGIPIRDDGCSACPTTLGRFDEVVRLGPYAQPLRSIIQRLKYQRRHEMLCRLGELLSETIAARLDVKTLDLVMPVPMHWRRRLVRGCDHARVLAGELARGLGLALGDELVRLRPTPPQIHLPRSRRIENVRGAFGLRSRAAIEGARVLLVDDVTTTGATANEAAKALLSGGALSVTLAVVAKAEPPTAYGVHLTA